MQCIHSFYAKLRCKFVSILNAISRLNFHGAVFVLFVKRTDYRMYRSQCIGGARYNSNKNDARHINCYTEMSTEVRSRGNSFRNVEAFPELRNQVALFEQDIRNELSAATAVWLSPGTRESNWRRISFLPRIWFQIQCTAFGPQTDFSEIASFSAFLSIFAATKSYKSLKWKYWLSRGEASKKRWNWETVRRKNNRSFTTFFSIKESWL